MLEGLAEEARLRRDAARSLELAFLRRLKEHPAGLGLETGLDVHGTRRLEADLASERINRRLDRARAATTLSPMSDNPNMFAALLSK